MGCWNGTCGVSQLPILAGCNVKAFLMLQSEFHSAISGSGSNYTTDFFRPWFFPVSAEYNDYGSIENIQKDWNSKYMLATFQAWLKEGKIVILHDDAEVNDPDIDAFEKLENVFDCVERGALIFNHTSERFDREQEKWVPVEQKLKIGLFMVLDNVFDSLVKESVRFIADPSNDYWRKHETESRATALKTIEKIRASYTPSPAPSSDNKELMAIELIRDMWVDKLLGDMIEEHCAYKHYKTVLYNPEAVTLDDFFAKLDASRNFEKAMSFLRKLWIPQTGQGSQSEELSFNKVLVQAMSEHIGHRDAEIEQQRIEDEKWEREYAAKQAKAKAKKKKARKHS